MGSRIKTNLRLVILCVLIGMTAGCTTHPAQPGGMQESTGNHESRFDDNETIADGTEEDVDPTETEGSTESNDTEDTGPSVETEGSTETTDIEDATTSTEYEDPTESTYEDEVTNPTETVNPTEFTDTEDSSNTVPPDDTTDTSQPEGTEATVPEQSPQTSFPDPSEGGEENEVPPNTESGWGPIH